MLDACTHFTYTILIKKSTKDTIHFGFSISRKMPITSHIFVPLLVHLFDVMQWHMYNVITITRRKITKQQYVMIALVTVLFILPQIISKQDPQAL